MLRTEDGLWVPEARVYLPLLAASLEVLAVAPDGTVMADGEPAWIPGGRRLPVAWYVPGSVGYLSVLAREESGWTSSP